MSRIPLTETIKFFRSYGVKCDEKWVEEWLNVTSHTRDVNHQIGEEDLYEFNEWCRWKDTAYEKGLDDQTKIERLLEEIADLKSEISLLKKEKEELENQLGMNIF